MKNLKWIVATGALGAGLLLALPASAQSDREIERERTRLEAEREALEAAREALEAEREALEAAREEVTSKKTWSWFSSSEEKSAKGKKPEPYVGVSIEAVPRALRKYVDLEDGIGLLIVRVHAGSPAAKAGLLDDDILVEFDGQLIVNFSQFSTLVDRHEGGDIVPVKVIRKGDTVALEIVIEDRVREGSRWLIPTAPAPPAPPPPPGADDLSAAPHAGKVAPRIVAAIREHVPGSVRIIIDENEEVTVDLEGLKSNLESLEERLAHLEIKEWQGLEGLSRLREIKEIRALVSEDESSPRHSIVHLGETNLSLTNPNGKVRIFTQDDVRYAIVTGPEGDLLFDGPLPENLDEEIDPQAAQLIRALLESTEHIDFDLSGEEDLPVEMVVEESEKLTKV